jgi:hypothetical protein
MRDEDRKMDKHLTRKEEMALANRGTWKCICGRVLWRLERGAILLLPTGEQLAPGSPQVGTHFVCVQPRDAGV